MQPSENPSTSNSTSASVVKQVKHDKQESDISVYKSAQNTKEESSDESTIISSQTSTLTRNQGCDELQTIVSLKLEELANCLRSPEEEDEKGGSESRSEDTDSEEDMELMIEDNILEDVLEHEVSIIFFLCCKLNRWSNCFDMRFIKSYFYKKKKSPIFYIKSHFKSFIIIIIIRKMANCDLWFNVGGSRVGRGNKTNAGQGNKHRMRVHSGTRQT